MRRLVLVRHAEVELVDGVPPEEWRLTEGGRAAAAALASAPALAGVRRVVASPEPKARETADALGVPVEPDARLREVRREGERVRPFAEHRANVARYLAGGDVPGWEPRDAVQARVTAAVDDALAAAGGDLALVSHAMALTLYLAALRGAEPDPGEWAAIPLPAVCVVDPAARRVLTPWHPG